MMSFSLHFDPALPADILSGIGVVAGMSLLLMAFRTKTLPVWRAVCLCAFFLVLLNPVMIEEDRKAVDDIAVLLVDRSQSQKIGTRSEKTDAALESLKDQLKTMENLDLRIVEIPASGNTGPEALRETRLFEALETAFANVPPQRRAGALLLTDGQVHDVPEDPDRWNAYGPVHALLTGKKDDRDREISILDAPAYGIVGESVSITLEIRDRGVSSASAKTTSITVQTGEGDPERHMVETGTSYTLDVPVLYAGQNVIRIDVDPLEGELTQANNSMVLLVNGVRDRLRVLLVSGEPHNGGRMWRDLLTSDPGVDLVHFTILREPYKLDATPQDELSLIAFPFRELFEIKLNDFDLIVFDRYRLNNILPEKYFRNIAKYVERGGALLEASGPAYGTKNSVYNTALREVLPGAPDGPVLKQPFTPEITRTGLRHPVTSDLGWDRPEPWGHWMRQVPVRADRDAHVLMEGLEKRPLLLLKRVGKGRVAQFSSDHMWLWGRGYEGGGPHAELLRRVAHWLMKEPELEEETLEILSSDRSFLVRRRTMTSETPTRTVEIFSPDGTKQPLTLSRQPNGWYEAAFTPDQLGVYKVMDGEKSRLALSGDMNPPELRSIVSSPDPLASVVEASGGSTLWLSDTPNPDVRLLSQGRKRYGGSDWIGLRRNGDYDVTGLRNVRLFPEWAAALGLMALLVFAWWREGRTDRN